MGLSGFKTYLVWLDKGLNVLVEVFLFFVLETFDVESNLDMGLFGSDGFNDILFLVDNDVLGLSEGLFQGSNYFW